jgi:hypothetical protein
MRHVRIRQLVSVLGLVFLAAVALAALLRNT